MRLTVLALAMLPVTAFAQETTLPAPTEPVAHAAGACAEVAGATSPMKDVGGHSGCSYGAAREVTS